MSVFGNQISSQVYDALMANAALLSLVTGVYDHVPQEEEYPYVVIGELVETPQNTDDVEQMSEASIIIHSYSGEWGRKETHAIQKEIVNSLHRAEMAEPGVEFVNTEHEQSQSFTDSDGITRHGVVEFNIIITEV